MNTMWAYEGFCLGFMVAIPVMIGLNAIYGDRDLNQRVREIRKRRLKVAMLRLEHEAFGMVAKLRRRERAEG